MPHMRILRSVGYASLLAAALVAFPTISRADTIGGTSLVNPATITYLLTSDHCTGGCGPQTGGFGQIVVSDLGGDVLHFAATLFNSNKFVQTGLDLTFAFNLLGTPSITYSSLTAGWNIGGGSNPQIAGSYHMDGTGFFQYGVIWGGGAGGGNGTAGPLAFDIAAAGLTLASLTTNADGQLFAVDILSGTTGNTGAVDASLTAVPEPSALFLVGTALLGIGYSLRNRIFRRT